MGDYYINDGNYRYGHSEYHQPSLPCYNNMMHHKQCNIRDNNIVTIRDDKSPYNPYTGENPCASCGRCNRLNRCLFTPTLVEIESRVDKVLTLVLYRENNNDDKTVKMRIGNKYTVKYTTTDGIVTATGVFKVLSENIPDDCTRYICNYSSASTAAYIGMDCSSVGVSDKRLIYIATIRDIEEVFDNEVDKYDDLTQTEKIQLMVSELDATLASINLFIEANSTEDDETSNNEDEATTTEETSVSTNPPPAPPPNNYYYDSPLIIGARPPRFYRWWENIPNCNNNNNSEEAVTVINLNEDLIIKLQDVRNIMSSYISTYNADIASKASEYMCCCCPMQNNTNNNINGNDNTTNNDTTTNNTNNNTDTNNNVNEELDTDNNN